jgi:integrase
MRRSPRPICAWPTLSFQAGALGAYAIPNSQRQGRREKAGPHGTLRLDPGTTKNDEGRVVYLTRELKRALTEQLERVDALGRQLRRVIPYLFPHFRGPWKGTQRRDFRKVWTQATTAAGCPGRLRHDFRRTAVRNLERAYVPRSIAMKITGHRTEAVYRRYAIVSDADLQAASERLALAARHNFRHNPA